MKTQYEFEPSFELLAGRGSFLPLPLALLLATDSISEADAFTDPTDQSYAASAMSSKIETLIQEFVLNLRAAIAEDAAEMFRVAAGGSARSKPGPKARVSSVSSQRAKPKGSKRTSEEIEAQAAKILGYLKKNPQHGAEQIGAALSMTTGELALPIKNLLAKKSLKTVGQKRGTKYSAK